VKHENVEGVPYTWLWSLAYQKNGARRLLNMLLFSFFLFFYMLKTVRKGDIAYLSSPQPFACMAGLIAARIKGARIVYEIRDLWPQILNDMGGLSKKNPVFKIFSMIENVMVSRSEMVVSTLWGVESYFKDKGIEIRKFLWAPNGISKEALLKNPMATYQASKPFTIIYAGAHGPAQNLHKVLEAFSSFSRDDVNLKLIGAGSLKANLVEYANGLHCENVCFDDPVPKSQIFEVLKSADALILPLVDAKVFDYGLTPNKLADYLLVGKPIIFFGPEGACILKDDVSGYVCSKDSVDALKSKIEYVLRLSDEERGRVALEGRKVLEENLVLDSNFEKIIQAIGV
tara:strand:+ start:5423 stop:6451 length:1029 start_codon:yes stop_codon:yes gene_type:complete